jgi:hypothetical protein
MIPPELQPYAACVFLALVFVGAALVSDAPPSKR